MRLERWAEKEWDWDMEGFIDHIEDATEDNSHFRRVVYTGEHLQLVLMSIAPGEDIGEEVHKDGDQFFRIETGHGIVTIDGREREITDGDGIVIPAGARHNIKNAGEKLLKLYTIYGPPHHRDGYVAATKDEAIKAREEFDGKTTEKRIS
jgi:mannose-6-phosphate isomerase-like protein (cupin superfamily)